MLSGPQCIMFYRDTRIKLKEAIGAGQAAGKVMREQYDAVTRELARTQAELGTCKQQQARLEESHQHSTDILQQEVCKSGQMVSTSCCLLSLMCTAHGFICVVCSDS